MHMWSTLLLHSSSSFFFLSAPQAQIVAAIYFQLVYMKPDTGQGIINYHAPAAMNAESVKHVFCVCVCVLNHNQTAGINDSVQQWWSHNHAGFLITLHAKIKITCLIF